MQELLRELDLIAPILNCLSRDLNASLHYDGLAGGVIWSDELPDRSLPEVLAFRYLIRLRTMKIMGMPVPSLEPFWIYARSAFPSWPGFSDDRCTDSINLAKVCRNKEQEFDDWFESEIGE